ncbi:hypothetical protein DH2020_049632 [Rehmannia glutinosa]|uniref:Uncharacterized protein n=1 Tax=Rehmannia glutinosa TaxID=99300 RepID=A0ABR0U2A5_REHGL
MYNYLSGRLPSDICNNIPNLNTLYLSGNQLEGQIPPNIRKCRDLEHLALSVNHFNGKIPSEIGSLSMLRELYLGCRERFGKDFSQNAGNCGLPSDICNNLPNLKRLALSGNQLEGQIPPNIRKCRDMEILSLSINHFNGKIPSEIGSLSMLRKLYLGLNDFKGGVPADLGNLSRLELLNIANASLTGPIPKQIGNCTSLEGLYLDRNYLTGFIPPGIGNLPHVDILILHSNKLTGKIPSSICNLTSLTYFHLSNNTLEGSIPECFSNLSKSLTVLHLKQNNLNGPIPTTFTKGCLLESLNLNGNKLEDTFPFWIETLPELRVLVLRSNRFNGTISLPSKTKLPLFPKLQVFDISRNAFSGSLPRAYLESFRGMINVKVSRTEPRNWFSYYQETMVFVLKGVELPIERILTAFTTIDFSDNKFSGSIPQSIGNLNSLKYLNLSQNSLTGNIPASLGNVTALESLDLSSNKLVGQIPWQLTRLTFLSKLNLSMNDLVGQIPQSATGQFSTFDNSSYMENSGLCGFPLTKKCKEDKGVQALIPILPQQGDDDSDILDGFTWQVVLLGYGCGFIFGSIIGCSIFRYERTKRILGFFGVSNIRENEIVEGMWYEGEVDKR